MINRFEWNTCVREPFFFFLAVQCSRSGFTEEPVRKREREKEALSMKLIHCLFFFSLKIILNNFVIAKTIWYDLIRKSVTTMYRNKQDPEMQSSDIQRNGFIWDK